MKKVLKEMHHVIPVSLYGWDVKANLVLMKKAKHTQVHKTLNMPYKRIRTFRKKHNHKFKMDVDFVIDLRKLHLVYFKNLPNLPYEVVVAHAQAMFKLCMYINTQHNLGISFGNTKNMKADVKFHYFLRHYHLLLWRIVKKL